MAFTFKRKWYGRIKHFIGCIYRLVMGAFEQVSKIMQTATIPFLSNKIFCKIQKTLLVPAIRCVFSTQRNHLYDDGRECRETDILEDDRCDSTDYNAKYGKCKYG